MKNKKNEANHFDCFFDNYRDSGSYASRLH